MSCFDRAFQMLCTTQPKRKRKCMFQEALKRPRGRRDGEGGGSPSFFLGQKLRIATSTFGISRRCAASWLTRAKEITRETTDRCTATCAGAQRPRGAAGPTPCDRGTSPISPRPIKGLLGEGKWKGSRISGRRWQGRSTLREGRSAPLGPSTPCSALRSHKEKLPSQKRVAVRRGASLGFFVCVCLFGFGRSGAALEESQIPCAPS